MAVAGIRSCNSCSAGGDSDRMAVTKENSVAFTEEACIHTCMYICYSNGGGVNGDATTCTCFPCRA